MARRKQRKRLRKRQVRVRWSGLARRWAPHAALALAPVVGLNLFVRWVGGGDAHPLSLRHLDHKAQAAGLLAIHALGHVFGSDAQDPARSVARAAREAGVPESFAIRIARAESSLRPHAISSTGAMGLMQLMPETADAYGARDPFDPDENARAATRYLRWLWDRYRGDRRRILSAYNAGPARVPRTGGYQIARETRGYVAKVLD